MAHTGTNMTFEDFTQSMMKVIDRALEANRASENQLMRESNAEAWEQAQRLPVESAFQEQEELRQRRRSGSAQLRLA